MNFSFLDVYHTGPSLGANIQNYCLVLRIFAPLMLSSLPQQAPQGKSTTIPHTSQNHANCLIIIVIIRPN